MTFLADRQNPSPVTEGLQFTGSLRVEDNPPFLDTQALPTYTYDKNSSILQEAAKLTL